MRKARRRPGLRVTVQLVDVAGGYQRWSPLRRRRRRRLRHPGRDRAARDARVQAVPPGSAAPRQPQRDLGAAEQALGHRVDPAYAAAQPPRWTAGPRLHRRVVRRHGARRRLRERRRWSSGDLLEAHVARAALLQAMRRARPGHQRRLGRPAPHERVEPQPAPQRLRPRARLLADGLRRGPRRGLPVPHPVHGPAPPARASRRGAGEHVRRGGAGASRSIRRTLARSRSGPAGGPTSASLLASVDDLFRRCSPSPAS